MYVCVHVCAYACMCAYVCMYVWTCVCTGGQCSPYVVKNLERPTVNLPLCPPARTYVRTLTV